jgi:cell division transport system ATP-binding protein
MLDKHPILENISIHIKPGEMVYLFGPSGAGKSTLLRLAHMEIMPTRGMVRVADFNSNRITRNEIPFFRRKVGVVFQDFKLLTDRDVFDNVSFALWATGVPHRKIKKRVLQVLAEVGLSHKRYAMIKTLSGGEQQRVAMARALANEPFILLADEPTGNLDDESSRDVLNLLGRINRRGTAVLMATHKEDAIHQVPGRTLRLKEGKLVS